MNLRQATVFFGLLCSLIASALNAEPFVNSSIALTTDETNYIVQKGPIRVCTDPNWMPYERINDDGVHEGMAADYIALFAKRAGLTLELYRTASWQETLDAARLRHCDIISMARNTQERREYLNFTKPYVSYPYVIATTNDKLFIDDIRNESDKTFAIVKGYASTRFLKRVLPNAHLIEVDNIDEGLIKVRNNEAFGYVDSVLAIGYAIKKSAFVDIKISGKLGISSSPSVAVRNDEPLLLDILQKAMDSVSDNEAKEIYNRWISVRFEQGFDHNLLIQILLVSAAVLAGLLYWNRRLAHANRTTQEALEKLNKMQVALTEKNEQLERIATTDLLTGLSNRLKVEESLQKEMDRHQRFEHSFSIILGDIDHFKTVNDTYGHQIGDQVLIDISNIMTQHIRAIDTLGRWGGEEFMIVCPGTDQVGATELANKLRLAISDYDFPIIKHKTASFGVATVKDDDNRKSLISRADQALYKAKNSGRNRVEYL